jgi:hypothetical protein
MWTLVVTTLVFAGSVAGGVAVNTTFLDFPDEGGVEKRLLRWRLRSALIRGLPGVGVPASRRPRITGSWRAALSAEVETAAHPGSCRRGILPRALPPSPGRSVAVEADRLNAAISQCGGGATQMMKENGTRPTGLRRFSPPSEQ